MELFKNLLISESKKSSDAEVSDAISIINKVFADWNKIGRRKNAVDMITSSANRLARLDPNVIPLIHDAAKTKLALICIRCMDLPFWKSTVNRASVYKKIYPILEKVQNISPNTETGGNVREVIMTRLSASFCYETKSKILVSYEPRVPLDYVKYLLGDYVVDRVVKSQSLPLPDDFSTLIDVLKINQEKANKQLQFNK